MYLLCNYFFFHYHVFIMFKQKCICKWVKKVSLILHIIIISLTFGTGLQLFLHQFFLGGELAQGDFWCGVILAHRTDHLLLFLVVHLCVDVNPRNFSVGKNPSALTMIRFFFKRCSVISVPLVAPNVIAICLFEHEFRNLKSNNQNKTNVQKYVWFHAYFSGKLAWHAWQHKVRAVHMQTC